MTALHSAQRFNLITRLFAHAFQFGFVTTQFGNHCLHRSVAFQYGVFTTAEVGGDLTQLHGQQFSVPGALFAFQGLIATCGRGLTLQPIQLLVDLFAQVVQTFEIFLGVRNAIFGVTATFLVAGNTGGFFDKATQVFRTRFNDARNHALFNDGVAA